MAKLFPTPDAIPFDVEEVYLAIENYKGYPSSRIANRHSPSLRKELKKCGWGIDNQGYIYPLDKSVNIFRFITRFWDLRAKICLAISIVLTSISPDITFDNWSTFLHRLPAIWVVLYCVLYCLGKFFGFISGGHSEVD